MKPKHLRKKTERLAGRYLIYLILIAIKTLPEAMLYGFSRILGNLAFHLSAKRRKLTITAMTFAFKDEKSLQEIRRLAKRVFCEIAWGGIHTVILLLKRPDLKKTLMNDMEVEGSGYLDEALKENKGVICVTAHFGNFMLMTLRLSLMGYPCNMIVKDPNEPVVAEIMQNMRREADIKWIPARPRLKAVSESLRWLKSGGILFFHADQNKTDGVYVNFFNRPAGSVDGPALLHLRTGAKILCAFDIRLNRNRHKIIITPPITVKTTGNRKEDVYQITQAYTKVTEDFVRRYPEQWYWAHNRWKSKGRPVNVTAETTV